MADKVIGMFDDYQKKLNEIPSLIRQAALNIQDTAKKNAPRDEGRLRDSITATGSGLEAEVFTNVEYAAYIEFGTGTMVDVPSGMEDYAAQFKGRGIKEVNISPQPYLMPAFEHHSERLLRAIKKILQ